MATMVCFHAHPDDETLATGGTMARAAAEGHRVVLVTATRGEHGEVPAGFLEEGEPLWRRRMAELDIAAGILGVARVENLGYVDSGMMGTDTNDAPESFWQADVDEAAARLAAILRDETPDVFTIYDENGNYGHPDHIQVHRVGVRAAEIAGTQRVFEATINRDHLMALFAEGVEAGVVDDADGPGPDVPNPESLGLPASMINVTVDIRPWLDQKRSALLAHASQVTPESFFVTMPREMFDRSFGQEWFRRRAAPDGWHSDDLFEGIPVS